MNILNRFSIQFKTYLLVLLSVVVAITLSLVSSNGIHIIENEVNELILVNNIERHTYRTLLEEKNYLLHANGSVIDHVVAKEAFDNVNRFLQAIYHNLDVLEARDKDSYKDAKNKIKSARKAIAAYEVVYKRGVYLLDELEKERLNLQFQGEKITQEIQEYVEAKRVDVRVKLSQKTIEKINAGSNIWQYTYMTRADEKRYLLSPDDKQYEDFKKDFAFMMKELHRLKKLSSGSFEYEKITLFHEAASLYAQAMHAWVKHNKEHVQSILPQTRELAQVVIEQTQNIANGAVEDISKKRKAIANVSLAVTIMSIIFGIVFGVLISRSISKSILNFQEGLLNFFRYLDRRENSAKQIEICGNNEISEMAIVVNENIVKIEEVMEKKLEQMRLKDEQMRKQSRLAQMGEMLSMIAHQWRQPLGAISATTSDMEVRLFKRRMYDLSTSVGQDKMEAYTLEQLHSINALIQHLSLTIDDFKDFFKSNKEENPFLLAALMDKTLNLTRHLFKSKGIDVIKSYATNLEELMNYESEVMQVLLNIIHNSADVLIERKIENASIYITIEKNRLGKQTIIIEDNAGGIDEDILSKIFDPYFSTKDKNGTGLGLYMSQMILQEHCRASINVRNTNRGACFILEFSSDKEVSNDL
ncbi:MAG: histidine kinase [Arcobacter sp.]|nr:MAG: histidine kinase [Arcobacter sp.]